MSVLEPRNFLQPCLLLLLRERADHGYDLVARLRPLHDGEADSGGVYRVLRGLEHRGLVRSQWCTSEAGPARRTYHLTVDGAALLDAQVAELKQVHEALHAFLDRYERMIAEDPPLDLTDDTRARVAGEPGRSTNGRLRRISRRPGP